jgi:RNA polymerase sigma factor (sigma-70 family)
MTLEELLADATWVRRVAAALVSEPADADDVAQLTWVAAIERPPAKAGDPRRWLATVARNIARMMGRGAARRLRREALIEGDAVPSPESLVERAQLQRQLATLLTELEEPYRTTVLLCYFEDLSPSEVARRLGISAGTVRWRLKRGLDQLRSRLDRLHTNGRAGWLVPMTAFGPATGGRHLSLSKGIVLMANKTAIAAGIGALAATTAWVGVYEGRVLLANHRAQAEQAARVSQTQSARFASSVATLAAHLPPPHDVATREELLKQNAEQRAEIVRLRAELNGLRQTDPFPTVRKHSEDFIKPPKDELLRMAKDCEVRWDSPVLSVPPAKMNDEFAKDAGVSDDERREVDRVTAGFTQSMIAQLRTIYVEVTGDKTGADSLTPDAMILEILLKVPEPVAQQAYWRLSHERAGLIPVPTDTSGASAFEKFLRLEQNAGDAFENALGATIGPERAHALRTEEGSWGRRMIRGSLFGSACPPGL